LPGDLGEIEGLLQNAKLYRLFFVTGLLIAFGLMAPVEKQQEVGEI